MSNPSVTILTNEYPPNVYGGAGIHVQYLAEALHALTQVEVRCFGRERPPGEVEARAFAAEAPWLAEAAAGPARVLGTVAQDLALVAPPLRTDVVHCHTWYTIFAGLLARIIYGKPLLATVHSLEPLRPWKEEQLGRGYQLSTWLERTGLMAADLVIAVSGEMRRDILRVYPLSEQKIRVIHNGVDPERFRPDEGREALRKRGLSEPYLLFVGRVSRQKGLDVLLKTAPRLPPELQVVICAGAADTPELEQELRELARSEPRVRWLAEMLPLADLVQLYSHAAVFVCPSIYEPFGLINLEAMACARPVVASSVGGIPEVVAHGQTGLLVPPGDAEALARAVLDLLEHPEASARMGQAGRALVEKKFSWAAIARQTLAAYAEAAANHQASGGR